MLCYRTVFYKRKYRFYVLPCTLFSDYFGVVDKVPESLVKEACPFCCPSFISPNNDITLSPCIVVTECYVIWVSEGNKRSSLSHPLCSAPSLTVSLFLAISNLFPPTWPSLHPTTSLPVWHLSLLQWIPFPPSLSFYPSPSLSSPPSFALPYLSS